MYQLAFAQEALWEREQVTAPDSEPARGGRTIARVASLTWEEHCVECAVPECYAVCPLYVRRADGDCARFVYGIYPHPGFGGLEGYGADVRFRAWAKLEANFERVDVFEPPFGDELGPAATATTNPDEVLDHLMASDAFLLACFSPHDAPFGLILEYFVYHAEGREMRFRTSFRVAPGENVFEVPTVDFNLDRGQPEGYIFLHPEAPDHRLIFRWADFVTYTSESAQDLITAPSQPAARVKCVAWDLDGTVWDGVLLEDEGVSDRVRPGVREAIQALDARGILQTVVSKNDYKQALDALDRAGLTEYFLHPAINWGQKSENLKTIAERLNIGVDTFALIDDSPFERAEVSAALPQVRVYDEHAVAGLLDREELDVPVTPESGQRRAFYQAQVVREEVRQTFSGSYTAFLASCEMKMRIFPPRAEAERLRCWELVERSNQLNLSGRRYTWEAFTALLDAPESACFAFACQDLFGDYGIVGFASVAEGNDAVEISNLVVSCRVAQKRIEHAFLRWLAARTHAAGRQTITAALYRSGKNMPMIKVLRDLRFDVSGVDGDHLKMKLRVAGMPEVVEPLVLEIDPTLEVSP